jgi:hypothetical protein
MNSLSSTKVNKTSELVMYTDCLFDVSVQYRPQASHTFTCEATIAAMQPYAN